MNSIKSTKLDNGIRVVTKSIEGFDSIVFGYWIEAGGVCEDKSNNGISHFLEHMAFKGTTTRTAKEIAEEIESVGGYMNAYTSKEITAYYVKVLGDDTKTALYVLSDILQKPTFLTDELEKERKVILQELYQIKDTPDDIIFDHFQNICFQNQAMGFSIIGLENVITQINSDDLRAYRSKHYNADNIIFAAAGNVCHDALLDMANKYLHSFQTNTSPICDTQYVYTGGSFSDVRDLEQVHAIIGFDGVSSIDDDYYTLAIFCSILGGGMSSRLFQEVREKRGLCYSIYSFSSSYKKNGVFGVYSATTADNLAELSKVVAGEILNMRDNISEKEFKITKAQFKASLLMAAENNVTSCEQIVSQTRIFGRPLSTEEILAQINAITIDDVKKITDKILSSPTSVVTVGKCDCSPILAELTSSGLKTSP
ncbi:MAG: insulinase family protein [Holosporaceae bacterium]|nr:insulinase family protein [Holosporaceae bacterium]